MNNSYDGETRDPEAPEISEEELTKFLEDPDAYLFRPHFEHWEQCDGETRDPEAPEISEEVLTKFLEDADA